MRPCLSPLGEEISQDGLTLAFQHAAVHFRTMADMRIARNIPNRTACTELGIPGTERDGADMGLDAGTRAHRARLKCDGQRAIGEIPGAQGLGRLTHGDDFGVGKRVTISLTRVVSAPDNLAGRIQHHRTNRYVTSGCSLTGQFQCAAHRLVIFHTNECMPFLISSHDVHNRPQAPGFNL